MDSEKSPSNMFARSLAAIIEVIEKHLSGGERDSFPFTVLLMLLGLQVALNSVTDEAWDLRDKLACRNDKIDALNAELSRAYDRLYAAEALHRARPAKPAEMCAKSKRLALGLEKDPEYPNSTKIVAIKVIRENCNCGLAEAKDCVEAWLASCEAADMARDLSGIPQDQAY